MLVGSQHSGTHMADNRNAEDRGACACRLCAAFGEHQEVQNGSKARRFVLRTEGKFDTDKTKNTYSNKLLKKYNAGPSGRTV